jgi:hypothetical protein
VFGRRRRRDQADWPESLEAAAGPEDEPDAGGWQSDDGHEVPADRPAGPWDAGDDVPAGDRIDFGSLLVPVEEAAEIQVGQMEGQIAWITVVHGDSGLQLQAFAAPKSSGLWDEVRAEIAAELRQAGGRSEEAPGPFGTELRAWIVPPQPPPGGHPGEAEPVRFLGVDGPRWFLRGVISGAAARREELAGPLERIFAGVVVNRGNHPLPPRDLLEIRLPDFGQEAADPEPEQPGSRWTLDDPFDRGPEITEIR